MSDFYKKFLSEDLRRMGASSGRQVFLAAFGKHPGWDDHVEDLGLESESLIIAKTRLYVEGIGGQIDSGAWEKLDPQQQIPTFKHLFLWQRGGQFLVGRMWSSSDGKGRTRYPMIVCAHCLGVPLAWAIDYALPALEKVEQECLLTKSAADVRFILSSARNSLRNALTNVGTEMIPAPPPVSREALAEFVAHPALGPKQEGWYRILYQMQSQMAGFAPGKFSLKGDLTGLRPQQLRVPPCGTSPAQIILLWARFFQTQLDPAVPFLLTLPMEEPWLDATLGEPTSHELFCLRASPKSVPLVSEVPYNLDGDFRLRASAILTNFQEGKGASVDVSLLDPKTPLTPRAPSTKGKFFKWFGGGAALVLIAGVLLFFFLKTKEAGAPAPAAKTAPLPASPAAVSQPTASPTSAEMLAAAEKARFAAEAEAKRLAEEKQAAAAAAEKAKAEAARAAEEREKMRLAAEAEARRKADEMAAQEAARLKAQNEAQVKPTLVATAQPQLPKTPNPPADPGADVASSRQLTNSIGMILVQISPGYWAGKFEVTQAEYQQVMGANPSKSRDKSNPRLPVESVTWNDAMRFCQNLSARETSAGTLPPGTVYTLPTEKQWNDLVSDAKFEQSVTSDAGRRDAPAPVGSTATPNKIGLFDVFGNVWEWSLDEGEAHQKLILGGAYNSFKGYALKRQLAADKQAANLGFRCVLRAQP